MSLSNGYSFGIQDGMYNVILDFKDLAKSSRSSFMRLYFRNADSSAKFYLNVFYSSKYEPSRGGLNFKDEVGAGEPLWIEVGRTRKGMPKILKAEYGWRHSELCA